MIKIIHAFFVCPPLEIVGKKQLVIAPRGYFEISRNKIKYKMANIATDFLQLSPLEATAEVTAFPTAVQFQTFAFLSKLFQDSVEFFFYSKIDFPNILQAFLYENIIPLPKEEIKPPFYELRPIPESIYEDYYRMSLSLEETLTTTIKTFDENVFIPFKQRFVASIHKRNASNSSNEVLGTFSRDFPKFFSLHQDLLTVLYGQAKEISEEQQIAFNHVYPILRRFRILNILADYLEIRKRRNRFETKIHPKRMKTTDIANKIQIILGKS